MRTRKQSQFFHPTTRALVLLIAGCLVLLGHAIAAPVVDSPTPSVTLEDTTKTPATKPSATATLPLTTQPAPQQQPYAPFPEGQQTVVPQAGPQMMPVPPTYAPGAPGAPAQGGFATNPYGAMPTAPTAFGLYDSPHPGAGGGLATQPSTLTPPQGGGMGMGAGQPMGTGFGPPPPPTPASSVGNAAMTDPSFGRFDSQSVSQATAPRQAATYGQAQSQVLRQGKAFQDYRPQSPYSPYMRLNRREAFSGGSNAYYEWVKPMLDQQQENRQVNREIGGLQGVARSGFQTMETLRQRPGNTIQQAAPRNPSTFMNTGQFYPGLGR